MMNRKPVTFGLIMLIVASFFTFNTPQLANAENLTFNTAINLSDNDTVSTWHEVAASGNNVYVVWQDNSIRADGTVETSNILIKVSTDGGVSFRDPVSIGTSYGSPYGPKITASGDNVYVVWVDNKKVQFSRSTDRGSTFTIPIILSNSNKESIFPQITAYGKHVYVAWQDGTLSGEPGVFTNTEILIRVSNDNGATFGPSINLSNNNGTSSIGGFAGAKITAYGNDVYVVWQDLTPGNFDVFLARSTDNGSTFDIVNLTNTSGSSGHPTIAAFGNNVYIAYQDDTQTGDRGNDYEVFFIRSTDRGENFAIPIKMSNQGDAEDPKIVVSGKHVYMIWRDASEFSFGSGSIKIFFARSTDDGKTFDPSVNLTGNGWSVNAWLAASGNSVYVGWQEKVGNKFEAYFRASTDYGVKFEPAINLSKGVGDSGSPKVDASGANVYAVWMDNGVGNADIFIRTATSPSFKPDPTVAEVENEYIKNSPKQPTQSKVLQFSNSINVYDTKLGFMAASAGNVYVLWMISKTLSDGTVVGKDVLFRAINNDGSFISPIIKLSNNERSQPESLLASGNNVYIAWFEKGSFTDTSPSKWDLFFSRSTDNGNNFEPPIKLSSDEVVYGPQIAVSGTNVYVIWMEGEVGKADILLSRSTDNGSTFNDPISLGTGWSPHIATSGNNVYVVWQNGDVFFRRSIDNGIRFESPINLSNDAGASISPRLAVSGNNVYIVWTDDVVWAPNKPAKRDTLFARSTNGGTTFASPINLSNSGDAEFAKIVATGNNVYVEWFKGSNAGPKLLTVSKDNGNSFDSVINLTEKIGTQISGTAYHEKKVYAAWMSNGNVFLGESKDFGVSFESKINLSSNGKANISPSIIISDNKLYVMWGEGDNFVFRAAMIAKDTVQASPLPAPITINHISNSKPRWGLDTVTISGNVSKASSLDTITIDWGDNTISNVRIIQQNGSWGPVGHTYDVEHVGKNQIVAKLFSGRVLKANSTYEIDVQKHATSITIDQIPNIKPGSPVTVTGSLFDEDAKVGISGRMITFDRTGVSDLSHTVTFKGGAFSSKGITSSNASTGLTIQAHFAGDNVYLPSDSNLVTYGTAKSMEESVIELSEIALVDIDGKKIDKASVGGKVMIQSNIKNKHNQEQPLTYIVQVKDDDGNTVFLSWIKGSLLSNQSMQAAVGWVPDDPSKYTAEIFVWESITEPKALSEVSRIKFIVS